MIKENNISKVIRKPLGECKEKTMDELDKIDNTGKYMSPFCGFQSEDDKIVDRHNDEYHYNRINFMLVGNKI